MIVSANLRTEMPTYDTPRHELGWEYARHVQSVVGATDVPCCMSIGTRRLLHQVIRAMRAKSVLDIGTYVGVSAMNYALAVGIGGNVVTLDIKDANAPDGFWAKTGRKESPQDMLMAAGVLHRVEFVTKDSVAFLQSDTDTYDFISIDGWHEAHQVYKEIELAMDRLRPGGLIFMDDVMQFNDPNRPAHLDYIPGPYAALKQHLDEGAPLEVVYNTSAFEDPWVASAFLLRKEVS